MGWKRDAEEGQGSAEEPLSETAGEGAPAATLEEGDAAADGETERLRAELQEVQDRYLRAVAEMDNVRRRHRQEMENERKYGNERLITELLPVADNLARALEAVERTSDLEALKNGVDLTHRQFSEVLERNGLERISALGEKFDPNFHEAISQVEAEAGQEPQQVVEELRAGYRLNDRVVRPVLVKVTAG